MPAFTTDPVYCPCPGEYHLLFPFDQQGKWRQFLKVNIKYNAIATALLFHRVLYLEGRIRSKDREINEWCQQEQVRNYVWLLGVWAFHISNKCLCSAGRTSQFWTYLRCWLVVFRQQRKIFPVCSLWLCVTVWTVFHPGKFEIRVESVCMEGGVGEGWWENWLLHSFVGSIGT